MPSNERPAIQEEERRRQEIEVGETEIIPLAKLLEDPEQVIWQVNERKIPAAITQHGQFLALIMPLAGTGFENYVFTQKQDLAHLAALMEDARQGPFYTVDELEIELGLKTASNDQEAGA